MRTYSTKRRGPDRKHRGFSLATMISLLFIMALVGGAAITLINTSLKLAQKQIDATEALNIADSGVDLAYTWLTTQDPPPLTASLLSMSNFYGTNGTIPAPFGRVGSSLVVRIRADAANPSATQKKYLVESTGTMPSGAKVTVRAYMQQVSFGKYAFFAANDGEGYWDYSNHFEGPFHSNDDDGKPTTIRWTQTKQTLPMFQYEGDDAFSVSGDVLWWKDNFYNVSPPTTTADFNNLAARGQGSMTTGYKTDANGNFLYDTGGKKIPNSPRIALPTTSYTQQYITLGLTPPLSATSAVPSAQRPTANGVTVTANGGIYIKTPSPTSTTVGDNDVTLSNYGGSQMITVAQKPSGVVTTQYVIIGSNSVTTYTFTGAVLTNTKTVNGDFNGLVYSDGNITSLKGTLINNQVSGSGASAVVTNRSAMTIVTDLAAGRDIYIADDISYEVTRNFAIKQADDTNYNLYAGTLGLLTRNAIVRDGAGSAHLFKLKISGSIFATGTFKAANPGTAIGEMLQMGGVIEKDSGIFAYGNNSGLISGYNEVYHYDNRLADNPPPYFPTTGTQYDVKSWQRVTNPL